MKKKIFLVVFFAVPVLLFSRDFNLLSIEKSYDELKFGDNVVQTEESSSGISVSVSPTTIADGEIIFAFDIRNSGDKAYYFDEKSITFYEGNFEKNEWNVLYYQSPSVYLESAKAKAITKTVLSAIGLGLSLLNSDLPLVPSFFVPPLILPGLDGLPNVVFSGRFYDYSHSPSFSLFDAALMGAGISGLVEGIEEQAHEIPFLEQNLLFSDTIKPDNGYFGLVYVPEFSKPDLKIEIKLASGDVLSFYYTRSDRKYIINPWLDRNYGRFSMAFGTTIPHFDEFNVYSLYNGTLLGYYFGFNLNFSGYFVNSNGTLYSNDRFALDSTSSRGLTFATTGRVEHILGGLSTGMTIKIVPYTWLMLGCGFNFYGLKIQGNVYKDTSLVEKNVWLDYNNFYFAPSPQIGISCLVGPIQVVSLFEYRFNYAEYTKQSGFNCKLMAGFAFD